MQIDELALLGVGVVACSGLLTFFAWRLRQRGRLGGELWFAFVVMGVTSVIVVVSSTAGLSGAPAWILLAAIASLQVAAGVALVGGRNRR